MLASHVHNEASNDAAFAQLASQVDDLADRVKEVLKPGIIDKMVADAIKPFEGSIRAKAEAIRNAAVPRHIREVRESMARTRGSYQLPAAD
ncbi:hypothetical protein [Devosia sp. SD17-2]|uniref:hypothetical protein n=1 Tax=Devosia sp. SD17-2 TaxID=2976459 RepID=UPI0023D8B856|nr:hypothetical protein [Devosia sp. SD17-2]WEJ31996.1 hypothetical protein NYQ88_13915 [Devosia sp. SD17-2]